MWRVIKRVILHENALGMFPAGAMPERHDFETEQQAKDEWLRIFNEANADENLRVESPRRNEMEILAQDGLLQ